MDDLFGVAALLTAFKGEKCKVVRSLDPKVWAKADILLDIGGIYDPKKNRFDHHQAGGAGFHESGIPLASFGLIWKKFGKKISGSAAVAEYVEKKLVLFCDAVDTGTSTYVPAAEFPDVFPFTLEDYIKLECIEVKEKAASGKGNESLAKDFDKAFTRLLPFAERVISLAVMKGKSKQKFVPAVKRMYAAAKDKRIAISEVFIPADLEDFPEVLVYVYKDLRGGWSAKNVPKGPHTYEGRMHFPESWRGLRDEELAVVTGVPDARFCHNAGFLAVAGSKEGILALVHKALDLTDGPKLG